MMLTVRELVRLPWQHGCSDVLASASSQRARPAQIRAGPLLGGVSEPGRIPHALGGRSRAPGASRI